jgi:glucosamine-6-phosphate deaminase
MSKTTFSKVEKAFIEFSGNIQSTTKIPYILVENFPGLGLLTSLRFLEWVAENPEGNISLPTGKTPEHFIKWTQHFLGNWNDKKTVKIRSKFGLDITKKPDLKGLHFIQIDEFYPIYAHQHNSFYYFVNEFYLRGFGLDPAKSLLINPEAIKLFGGRHFREIFPDLKIDLSLRYRECSSSFEKIQQQSVFLIDNWCSEYEAKIREKGGIGFFLGGIGPDGHIAFNTRGSDHFSTTRLTATNFETQAVAAGDLGGIDVSRNRLVITIGLDTITYNPDATAIIIAAGEAKAEVIRQALESNPSNLHPASVLSRLDHSRFYLTRGAASGLTDMVKAWYRNGDWTMRKTERAVIELCKKQNIYGHKLTEEDLLQDEFCKMIPGVNLATAEEVIVSIGKKLTAGMMRYKHETFLHTGPHHDDIMLGILPLIARQLRSATNNLHFAVLTSGFTAVTNRFVIEVLTDTLKFLDAGQIQMTQYPDFFTTGYKYKWDKDVYHYLNKVASGEEFERRRGLCHRIVRALVDIYRVTDEIALRNTIVYVKEILVAAYDGKKNEPPIQKLKGMIREFEEDLVWAHFGVQVKNVHHLRLGFYTGDIFTGQPEKYRDVMPVLELLRKVQPTVLSLTLDPEGSGPDTHYKVLQATAEAVRLWSAEKDLSNLKIWGYRNVWFRFHPSDAEMIAPVSLNAMSLMDSAFKDCYLSQVDAPFPSYQLDGKFSDLAKKIWVEQLKEIQLLLGKDFFYENNLPLLRASHGMIYFREMNVEEFLKQARELEKTMEGAMG